MPILRTRGGAGGGLLAPEYAGSEGQSDTTSLTYIDKTTLTFTAKATTYLIIYSAEAINGDMRLYNVTDAAVLGEINELSPSAWFPMAGAVKLTLSAGSKTFKIQWLSNGGTASIRRARITIIEVT